MNQAAFLEVVRINKSVHFARQKTAVWQTMTVSNSEEHRMASSQPVATTCEVTQTLSQCSPLNMYDW